MGIFDKLRDVDIFGKRIEFTYQNHSTYKTRLGGCCTIVAILFLLGFFSQSTYKLLKSPEYSRTTTSDYISFPVNEEPTRISTG